MKVLILGASGFIGRPVAEAFSRAGHIVYGQTRSESTGVDLAKNEILAVVCDPLTDEGRAVWGEISSQADVAGSGSDNALKTFRHFLTSVSDRPPGSPKATYIYTGGLWSNSRGMGGLDKWSDERQPRSDYNEAVRWRAEIEERMLREDSVNAIVIRPPIMYGRSQSAIATYILNAAYDAGKKGKGEVLETYGYADTRWQTAHQDDVGDLFVRVAERAPICSGQVFLAANPQSERLTDVLDAVVRVSGAKGYKLKKPETPYDKAWASTLLTHVSLATALTGWHPRKLGLVDGMDIYWAAYVANREKRA